MSSSEHAELTDLIERVFHEVGGRATAGEMMEHLTGIPEHLNTYLVNNGLKTLIGQYFRSRTDAGLPTAPEIDSDGTHAQLELLSVEEFRYVVRQQMNASRAARQQAKKYADKCAEVHGITIDLDNPFEEAA